LIAEYDGSNTLLRRYAHGGGTDNPVLCANGGAGATQKCLGVSGAPSSVTMLADERGSVVAYLGGSTGALAASAAPAAGMASERPHLCVC
jgi:hypothetical protein